MFFDHKIFTHLLTNRELIPAFGGALVGLLGSVGDPVHAHIPLHSSKKNPPLSTESKLRRMNAWKGKESLQTTANISAPVPCNFQLFLLLFYEAISVTVSLQNNILSRHITSRTNLLHRHQSKTSYNLKN